MQQFFATNLQPLGRQHSNAHHAQGDSRYFQNVADRDYDASAVDTLLPPRLVEMIAEEADQGFALRLLAVDEAAARAIGKLGDLDLISYEETDDQSSADLGLWEQGAPVVGSTLGDVSALVSEIAAAFPPNSMVIDPKQNEVDAQLQRAHGELQTMMVKFGMRVRDPSVVGDRWNLISELQSFRFQFRERIGSMVFSTTSALGDCRRSEVEPGYDLALRSTLLVRSMTADLRRLMRARLTQIREAQPEDVEWNAKQIEKELNAFGRTAAWRALRAQDKKTVLEFRTKLQTLLSPEMSQTDLAAIVEPFAEFVEGFAAINKREILVEHDQEVQAAVGVLLERAMNASAPVDQLAAFQEAVGESQQLYGRSPDFDAFLRKVRKAPATEETVAAEVESLLMLLSTISMQ